jgi:hypothetical protein
MNLADLLNGVRVRAPWQAAGRPMLAAAGFNIHRGYDETIQGALQEAKEDGREDQLTAALKEHLVAGEKLVRIAKLRRDEAAKIRQWISGKRRTSNTLTDAFPGVASNAEVRAHMSSPLFSVGALELEKGTAALFTASRWYLDRVEIPVASLKASAAEGFEKLIGVQRIFRQTYDAIWMPESGNYACVCTDFPQGAPRKFADTSQAALITHLRTELGRAAEFYNLWPAVDGLYEAPDGKLVDYGFVVAGQSVNHHKARRRADCLRTAVYDAAGAAAVGDDLLLFKVAMQWTLKRGKTLISPELLLPGTAADLNKPNAVNTDAVIRNCLTSRDLDFVVSKLLPHIN